MSYVIAALYVLLIGVMWWERNRNKLRRDNPRGCYHGITRHDPDWEE